MSVKIYADYFWPHFSWSLKKEIGGFKDLKGKNLNTELKNSKVDYYIALRHHDLSDYQQVAEFKTRFGYIVFYKRF